MQAVGRRTLLKTAAAGIAAAISPAAFGALAPPDARLKLNLGQSGATIPADFTGLSYESSQLAHPSFFSAQNTSLIQLFRTLGERGVLRIGGNMSEFTVWSPVDTDVTTAGETEGPDPGKGSDRTFTITPRAIQNLAEFLNAVNWRLIYGLNLAKGTPESATEEASCVAKKIGARLLAFQFGNEPDLFKQAGQGSPHWTYDQFIAKWQMFSKAVRQRLPGIPLAGPDTSFKPDWVERFTADTKGEVALLTTHYYAEGPPTDPRMTIDYLLHPGERFATHILEAISVARRVGLPYRMAEGNSCYAAGKKGVSDTFASALWVADFMLSVAQAGGTGVNLHGGGDGLYTPIAGSSSAGFTARPIFYGMSLAGQFAGARFVKADLDTGGANLAAYAAVGKTQLLIAAINREPHAVDLALATDDSRSAAGSVLWLTAPAIDSTGDVRFGNAKVMPAGNWQPAPGETMQLRKGTGRLRLPAYTAAFIALDLPPSL